MSIGRVGRAHGRDGSFYVEGAQHPLPADAAVTVAGEERRVEWRAGSDQRPLVRLAGIEQQAEAAALHGEPLLVDAELERGEWLAEALVGREVTGLGRVERVLDLPSCSVLELDDGTLVPFVSDAIRSVGDAIEVDSEFLNL